MIVDLIEAFYRLLWGDLFPLPVAGGIGISFMVVLLFAAGIGFTLRTRLLPVRLFRDACKPPQWGQPPLWWLLLFRV